MKEVFYSELLNSYFDDRQKCLEAEIAEKKRLAEIEKKKANKEVRQKELTEAFDKYMKLKEAFIKDYGFAGLSFTNHDGEIKTDFTDLKDIINSWFE